MEAVGMLLAGGGRSSTTRVAVAIVLQTLDQAGSI